MDRPGASRKLTVPHPELPRYGWRSGATAMRMLGIDHTTIERYWPKARRQNTDASLPLHWVLAFVPARLWAAVLTLIQSGPAETGPLTRRSWPPNCRDSDTLLCGEESAPSKARRAVHDGTDSGR